MNFFNIKRC